MGEVISVKLLKKTKKQTQEPFRSWLCHSVTEGDSREPAEPQLVPAMVGRVRVGVSELGGTHCGHPRAAQARAEGTARQET